MNASTDQQLLRAYAASRSESAFAELVRRHVDLVHSAAMRMVRNPHTAEDVTQAVFTALATDARRLSAHPVLAGWLHRTTRNLSANTLRADARRKAREQQAIAMHEPPAAASDAPWADIASHLDEVLGELSAADRDAVILRYFEKCPAKEIAATLGITTEAAQKRVNRAVERLRESFAKRGVTASGTGLATAISTGAVQAAPSALAATISTNALERSAAAKLLAMTPLQKIFVPMMIAVLAGAWVHQKREAARLRVEVQSLSQSGDPRAGRQDAAVTPVRTGRERSGPAGGASVAAGVWTGEWHGFDGDPELTSFDKQGRPTTDAVERFELTDAEVESLEAAVAAVRREATEDFVKRMKRIDAGPGENGSHLITYEVPARPDRGQHFVAALSKSFEGIVGKDRAESLMSGMAEDSFLGGMGKDDLEFEFTRGAEGGMRVKFKHRNPQTGEITRNGESAMEWFEEDFGKVFGFPEEPVR